MKTRVEGLIKASREVILDCCLENGAVVAANSSRDYYPKEAKNYFYVWPRDAAYTCIASDILGLEIQEGFFDWLMNKAEGWRETGLFYEKYYPSGLKAADRFQPDQTGTVLLAISHHFKINRKKASKYKKLITHSADGICSLWRSDHFKVVSNDVWEERLAFPDLRENFTYSLAACIKGLLSANDLFPDGGYIKVAGEMRDVLLKNARRKNYFPRSFGRLGDERIDASALGVIWPFEIVGVDDSLAVNTVRLIEEKLARDYGVYRYEHDEYDGWMFKVMCRRKGAGFWPLLNCWMSIVLNRMGRREDALGYYNKVLSSVGEHIPEQVFGNEIQVSVSPLCWSHSMFILASRELGFI